MVGEGAQGWGFKQSKIRVTLLAISSTRTATALATVNLLGCLGGAAGTFPVGY